MKPPFKPGDRVRNATGATATVTSATNSSAGWTLGVQYAGTKTTVYRPAHLFKRILKS
jgi:hypothetical protein